MKYKIENLPDDNRKIFLLLVNTLGENHKEFAKIIDECNKNGGEIDITVKIAGIEVDIIEEFTRQIEDHKFHLSEKSGENALEIIHNAGLDELYKIQQLLERSKEDIRQIIEKATGIPINSDY